MVKHRNPQNIKCPICGEPMIKKGICIYKNGIMKQRYKCTNPKCRNYNKNLYL